MTDHKFPASARSLVASEVELFTEIDLYMAIAAELTASAIAVATHPIVSAWTDFADTVAMLTEGTGEIMEELGQSRPVLFAQTIIPTIAMFAELAAPKASAAWTYSRPRLIKSIAMLAASLVAIAKVWTTADTVECEDPENGPAPIAALTYEEFRNIEAELSEVLALTTKNSEAAADLMAESYGFLAPEFNAFVSEVFASDLMAGGHLDPEAVLTCDKVISAIDREKFARSIESPRRKKKGVRAAK